MPKPFDATMRELFELEPAAWLEFLGIPVADPGLVKVIDSNLSTITADADKLIRLDGVLRLILHIEFLSGRDTGYPAQALWYNTLVGRKHGLPVWSVVILLRPEADGPELTGEYEREVPGRGKNLWFRYDVVRVWELPPDRLLTGGLPLLPLAPVSNVAPERLSDVLTAVANRLRDEAAPELTKTLWTATAILTGLRFPRERVGGLIEGVANMVLGIRGIEESWVYQDIFTKGRAEGEVEEARKILLGLGRKRLGEPAERVLAEVAAISDLDRLDLLLDRLLDVSTWDELLAPAVS
jgi:predicted transposase YdaD